MEQKTYWVVTTSYNESIEAVCSTHAIAMEYIATCEGGAELHAQEVYFHG